MPPTTGSARSSSLLAAAPTDDLVALADRALATAPLAPLEVVRPPEVGSVLMQVREPIARTRFHLADLLVSSAEVRLAGQPGWAMRAGADLRGALAQAVCEAELARRGPLAEEIAALLDRVETAQQQARAAEWQRLQPTAVTFEEVM
ncbi:phosphonate C-P lyase system protein PhnG [Granulicoccus phenolivorans]|uniref:phosphonate C-P lyase system protein PhnG n=1 Tax=Granulicoccus phenolivorans TaxID=266854 RepID=UPI0003FCAEC9|nr:phosphonate C-P lyase system protein PhnG [Granulicoccus phenolivorans]